MCIMLQNIFKIFVLVHAFIINQSFLLTRTRRVQLGVPCLLLFTLISTLTFAQTPTPPIKIGAAFALTGDAKDWGTGELNGAKLAVEDFNAGGGLNGAKVELIVEDTKSTNAQTLNAINKLVNIKGLKLIVGPTWLDSYASPLAFTKQKKVLLVTPSAAVEVFKGNKDFHELVFTTWYSTTKEIDYLLTSFKEQGIKSYCSIFDQDPFFQMMMEHNSAKAQELRLTNISQDSPQIATTDFKADILKMTKNNCDAFLIGVAGDAANLSFFKQFRELNPDFQKPLYGFHDLEAFNNNENFKGVLSNVNYVRPKSVNPAFRERYKNKFNQEPGVSSSNAYDATSVILQSLKADKQTPEEIGEYLRTGEFETITFGRSKFTEKRNFASGDFEIVKIK